MTLFLVFGFECLLPCTVYGRMFQIPHVRSTANSMLYFKKYNYSSIYADILLFKWTDECIALKSLCCFCSNKPPPTQGPQLPFPSSIHRNTEHEKPNLKRKLLETADGGYIAFRIAKSN
jgi:hypothetical protein